MGTALGRAEPWGRQLRAAEAVPGGVAADRCLLTLRLAAGAEGPSEKGIGVAWPSILHTWLASGEGGAGGVLNVILLRRPEIAFVLWRPKHTPGTHPELIVWWKPLCPIWGLFAGFLRLQC